MFKSKSKKQNYEIDPDEIFLDSSNLPEFDRYQFEGRLEKPISKNSIVFLGSFFLLIVILFIGKLVIVQVQEGEMYRELAENNRLNTIPIFPERGVIFDRNNIELVWNVPFEDKKEQFSKREYIDKEGFSHVLGYIRYPSKDSSGFYYQDSFEGKDGIELAYGEDLGGRVGLVIIETDALGKMQSQSTVRPYIDGRNIILTIDARLQEKMFKEIKSLAQNVGFNAGAGIVMDITTGAVLSLVSYPEYDSGVLSDGEDDILINDYINDDRDPFLNRAVLGLYTPGSIIKLFVAISALNEKVITSSKKLLSTGSISIPNPYFPEKESIFTDWKAHGWVDMKEAIAVSSNVYFYNVGGGFLDQEGVGIAKLEVYFKLFGFSKKSGIDLVGEAYGVIPNPKWKERTFGDEWRIGDTYNTVIGQYGFSITPIQAVRAVSVIANGGTLLEPYLVESLEQSNNYQRQTVWRHRVRDETVRYIDSQYYEVVREGMRQAVTEGTAKGLDIGAIKIAAKTGTAEIGIMKKRVNSWVIGFYPYENPQYAFAVVMEKGPQENLIGALYVMRRVFEWMAVETPEYLR